MRDRAFRIGNRIRKAQRPRRATLRTIVLLLPRFRNPEATGTRKKIELSKWKTTLREMEKFFPGYQRLPVKGWNKEDNIRDHLYRFEADLLLTRARATWIRRWKVVLAERFEQREIYLKISEQVMWI